MSFKKKSFQNRFLVFSLTVILATFSLESISHLNDKNISLIKNDNDNTITNFVKNDIPAFYSNYEFIIKDDIFYGYELFTESLFLFDLSNIERPVFIEEINFEKGDIIDLKKLDDNLFVVFQYYEYPYGTNLTLATINISNATNPIITSEFLYESAYYGYESSALVNSTNGFYWIISDENIKIMNYSNINSPTLCKIFNQTDLNLTTPIIDQIIIQNNIMYTFECGFYNYTFGIFNVTDPLKPQIIGEGRIIGGEADKYLLYNDYLFCIDRYEGRFRIIDVGNKSNPSYIRAYRTNSHTDPVGDSNYLYDIEFNGNIIYVVTEDKIQIYDIVDPQNAERIAVFLPEIIPSFTQDEHVFKEELGAGSIIQDKLFLKRYTYLRNSRAYSIIDLTDPINLEEIIVFGKEIEDWRGEGLTSTIGYNILQISIILIITIRIFKDRKQVK